MNKVKTISLKGNDYATVPVRLKEFREQNPNADIDSEPHWNEDGSLDFRTRIIKDQKDPNSAKGTGWAHYSKTEVENPKAFEKLQTISKGRALADIGYLNNGEIATTEEMEEFNQYKEEQMELITGEISTATTQQEFKDILAKLTPEQKRLATPLINERIQELKNAKAD